MNRLMPLFAAAWLAPAAAVLASTPAAAIRSQAELNRYLHDTPIADTPLAPLSPGGRKRFLGELKWGSHGLGTVPLDDIDNELTHEQAVRLLTLFDAQAFARGLGLTPAERARRETERAADAKARDCNIDTCPESAIEQRFDALMLLEPDPAMPDAEQRAEIGQHYDRLFSGLQRSGSLRGTSEPDLRLLQRAAEYATSWQPNAAHIADLQADLAELQRRRMTDDRVYTGLYRALVASRQLVEASTLAQRHPGMGVDAMPAMASTPTLSPGQPTALLVDAAGRTMVRQAIDLSAPWRIVVVAACHFSEDSARDISADPQLRPLFARHAIWLASQNTPFAAAAEWNRRFPDQPIHVAWQDSEWSMLDDWDMPTFYVFRRGRLVDKWSSYDMDLLRTHLRKDGLLH
ncbi:hypothetical protein ABQJ54_18620 [Rhodanobacter sp. Si-c]|uniref:Thioredoxin domain-containing protein n=1 Tax=Rhodanobacter lycopersici TaxID=3162487 RepID=A0ABV3QJA7_9GAMM